MKPARGPQTFFLAIIVMESQGLPTMRCQAKCAKAIFVGLVRHRDSRSARNGCHGMLPGIQLSRLKIYNKTLFRVHAQVYEWTHVYIHIRCKM